MYTAYLLLCGDGTLYAGYAADIDKRLALHQSGKGAKYTRGRLPVVLAYSESFATKSEAMRREYEFKRMRRSEKERFIGVHPAFDGDS